MISDQDITKLKKVFVTKDEFADLKLEVGEIKEDVQMVLSKLDIIAGGIQDLREDNAVGIHTIARHERNFKALAEYAGITLPD